MVWDILLALTIFFIIRPFLIAFTIFVILVFIIVIMHFKKGNEDDY